MKRDCKRKTCVLGAALVFFVASTGAIWASASEPPLIDRDEYLLTTTSPYVPREVDYSLELGAMSERRSLYWLGASGGFHVGRCILTGSETCQQYLDLIVGFGGRESETYGLYLGSIRWQFVNFPRSWSPSLRLFGGGLRAHTASVREWRLATGVGLGVTIFLHSNADLRFEARGGISNHAFSQGMMAIEIKTDRILERFAGKLAVFGREPLGN